MLSFYYSNNCTIAEMFYGIRLTCFPNVSGLFTNRSAVFFKRYMCLPCKKWGYFYYTMPKFYHCYFKRSILLAVEASFFHCVILLVFYLFFSCYWKKWTLRDEWVNHFTEYFPQVPKFIWTTNILLSILTLSTNMQTFSLSGSWA